MPTKPEQTNLHPILSIVNSMVNGKTNAIIAATYGTFFATFSVAITIAAAWILKWTPMDHVPIYLQNILRLTPPIMLLVLAIISGVAATLCLGYYWKHRADGPKTNL